MHLYELCFSPTGGTRRVANVVTRELEARIATMRPAGSGLRESGVVATRELGADAACEPGADAACEPGTSATRESGMVEACESRTDAKREPEAAATRESEVRAATPSEAPAAPHHAKFVNLASPSFGSQHVRLGAGNLAVIAAPVYGGRIPEPAVSRLGQVMGNGARAVVVAVYGNRAYEDALVELRDAAEAAGFNVVAAIAAVAEHSIARKVAQGRPDDADRELLRSFADRIAEGLLGVARGTGSQGLADSGRGVGPQDPAGSTREADGHDLADAARGASPQGARVAAHGTDSLGLAGVAHSAGALDLPGSRPYKKRSTSFPVPRVAGPCDKCGICIEQCPTHAISDIDPRATDTRRCISCMRCVQVCPHHSRRIGRAAQLATGVFLRKTASERREPELFLRG